MYSIGCSSAAEDPLFMEMVNEVYFNHGEICDSAITPTSLTVDEEGEGARSRLSALSSSLDIRLRFNPSHVTQFVELISRKTFAQHVSYQLLCRTISKLHSSGLDLRNRQFHTRCTRHKTCLPDSGQTNLFI